MGGMQTASRSRVLLAPLAVAIALVFPVLAGCSGSAGNAAVEAEAEPTNGAPAAGPEAAAAALDDGRTVIDVRTPEEYDAGHIEGAELVNFQSPTFADDIADLDPDGSYVVYCRSGNRSAQAARQMTEAGLDVVDGGAMADMESAGWTSAS